MKNGKHSSQPRSARRDQTQNGIAITVEASKKRVSWKLRTESVTVCHRFIVMPPRVIVWEYNKPSTKRHR